MSPDLEERVSELLSAVREELESGAVPEDVTGDSLEELDEEFELADHAATAREIVESNDPETVLEAVGLSELPDGSEPASIPEAIARGSDENVRDLHALVTLASLAEWGADEGADELEGVLSDLRETLGAGDRGEPEADETSEANEAGEDPAGDEAGDDAGGDEAATATESTDDGEADEEAESDSGIESALKAAAGTTASEFSDDVRALKGRLEALSGGEDESEEAGEGESDAEEPGDEDEPDDEGEPDDGFLDDGDGIGGDESTGRSSTHSTMPPPPSKRADMRAVRRHSTMPDRH